VSVGPARRLRLWLLGRPLTRAADLQARLPKRLALPVFSSDALSSVAYATEEILLVLVLAGSAALAWSLPIGVAIVVLLAIVISSYRQTIEAYPAGGGAYIVASDNLGVVAGLWAAAALLIDYVLTVSVSVAAGVAAVTSALPALDPHREPLGVAAIAVIAGANLRGVRESGRLFAIPTYGFVGAMVLLIGAGGGRLLLEGAVHTPPLPHEATNPITLFLLLRAFASGCTALTGVEAISNGVPAFQPPEARNARITLVWMAVLLGVMFAGITWLAGQLGVVPTPAQTVLSQIARWAFGDGVLYCATQAVTALILVLAANTSFADFPRLGSLLARDGFLPRQLTHRGDRLVFSNGILALAVLAGTLIVAFGGQVNALIPLYAVGVFLSFTLSQAGMIRHWWRRRGRGWPARALVNGVGALATAAVTAIIAVTKFTEGAWLVVVLIPLLVFWFWRIRSHYEQVARQLAVDGWIRPLPRPHRVVVPVSRVHRATLRALDYARQLGPELSAVYVDYEGDAERVLSEWGRWADGVPLVVLTSPYRSLIGPLLEYLDGLRAQQGPGGFITVVLPEFVPRRWWHHALHNQSALLLKGALFLRPNVVVVDVPYHLAG
jgi:amino acid transporter